jgi:MFS family permease
MKLIKRSPVFFMALTIFIDFAGFGIVLPLLPFWTERRGASPVGVGLVLTIYALAQFLFTPVLGRLSDRYGRRPIILASLLIEALSLALSAEAVLPLFTQHAFGWTALQNGAIFTYAGMFIVLMRGSLVGKLVKCWGEGSLVFAGLVLLAVGLALLSWSTNLALLLAALGIVSIGDGVVMPTVSALLSFASPSEAQGETLGLAQGIAGLGRVIGPLAAGSLFAMGGSVASFFFASALVVLAALIALPVLSMKHEVSPTHAVSELQEVYAEKIH